MSTNHTPAIRLNKPGFADRNWHLALNDNADRLDGQSALAGLCVTTSESPSVSLNVRVAPGRFQKIDGSVGEFAGQTALEVPSGAASYVYLDPSGSLGSNSSGFPPAACVPLAIVQAGSTTITAIIDGRVQCAVVGAAALPFLPLAGGSLNDGADLAVGAATGTRIASTPAQKLGFWGAAPVVQPGPYVQSYSTADRTISAYSPSVQAAAFSGLDSAQAGAVYARAADLNALRASYENLRGFAEDVAQTLNSLIDDLQAIGLVR